MGQTHTVGKTATSIRNEEGYKIIRYHNTDVVKFNQFEIILNTGGWWTATTKNRMNQASNQFGLGFGVYQKRGVWFVEFNGETQEFVDDVLILKRI